MTEPFAFFNRERTMNRVQPKPCSLRLLKTASAVLAGSLTLTACLTTPVATKSDTKAPAQNQALAAPETPPPRAANPGAPRPAPAPAPAPSTTPTAAPAPAPQAAAPATPTCERLPTMSNQKKVAVGAAIGALAGGALARATGSQSNRRTINGALGGALVGALAGSAFKSQIDVEEQPDGSVRLKIPGSVMFASGQHALSQGFQSTLNSVTQTIKRYCDVTVRVVGYTDNVGALASNRVLSENRARSVQAYMHVQGFERARVQIEGRGSDNPVADNSSEQGRQLNRRVEVFVFPPAG
jgi:outer membrane protein OmpA-like peptidoglycan-associated protein